MSRLSRSRKVVQSRYAAPSTPQVWHHRYKYEPNPTGNGAETDRILLSTPGDCRHVGPRADADGRGSDPHGDCTPGTALQRDAFPAKCDDRRTGVTQTHRRRADLVKIAHVLAPGEAGGAETVVEWLATGQAERGHDVRVAAVTPGPRPEPPLVNALEAAGVRVLSWKLGSRAYLREASLVRRLCRSFEPDILHTHGYRSDVVGGLAARGTGVRRVTTVHGFCRGGPKNRLYERLQRWAYRSFDGVVAVSRAQEEELIAEDGLDPTRVHLIRNAAPIDLAFETRQAARDELELEADEKLIGWIGRLSSEKGLDVLLRAMRFLADVDVGLVVVGSGREDQRLRALAAEEGVTDRVAWKGNIPHAARLLRAFDLVCLSSRTEGMPMVLLEAMAAEVPIVSSRVGGVPEAVSDQEARLVPPEAPEDLARALREVLRQPDEARLRARRAGEKLRRDFGRDAWISRYEEVYTQMSGRRRVRP